MVESTPIIKTKEKNPLKKIIIGSSILIITFAGIYSYYRHSLNYPSTDNAYISANLVNVAPKVGGFIRNVYVKNNQMVHKGDLLVDIDPQDYTLQIDKANQNMLLARQQAENVKQQIANAQAGVAKAKSDYQFATDMAKRYTTLYKQNAGSEQDMQKYVTQAVQAKQSFDQAKVALDQANTQYQVAKTQIDVAKVEVDNAKTTNGYTQIYASVNGYVTNLNLAKGQLVLAGQTIFGLVDDNSWWVDVNFKETQLARIKPGQKATIKLDMYDHEYTGVVDSISRASGNTFSLLPAQNATGNWVKVTQRFTVKVKLPDDSKFPLRVGASSEVTIDTVSK